MRNLRRFYLQQERIPLQMGTATKLVLILLRNEWQERIPLQMGTATMVHVIFKSKNVMQERIPLQMGTATNILYLFRAGRRCRSVFHYRWGLRPITSIAALLASNVGAYSITDGDCDMFNFGNVCDQEQQERIPLQMGTATTRVAVTINRRTGRSVFHYRWGLRLSVPYTNRNGYVVGAYSITDGDCDARRR